MSLVVPDLSSAHPGLSSALPGLSLVLPGLSLALPGLSLVLPGLSSALPGWSLVLPGMSLVLRHVLKLITITLMELLYQSSEIPVSLKAGPSAKKYSVRAEWLRQSGRGPSKPSETPRWRITPRSASIQCVALYIGLRSLFHCLFAFCRSPILNDHSRVVANCDNTSEWVHWVHTCIGIAMRWVTLRISLLAFLLPVRKMQFSLY